jgi:hypothetical protein
MLKLHAQLSRLKKKVRDLPACLMNDYYFMMTAPASRINGFWNSLSVRFKNDLDFARKRSCFDVRLAIDLFDRHPVLRGDPNFWITVVQSVQGGEGADRVLGMSRSNLKFLVAPEIS